MTKKIVFIFLLILLLIGYIFHIDKDITNRLDLININIQSFYYKYITNFKDTIETFYNQKDKIKSMQKRISQEEHYKLLYEIDKNNSYLKDENKTLNIVSTRVISYLSLLDFSKVILNSKLPNIDKIYPLVTKRNNSAGIVMYQDYKTIAYLNTNKRCNYAVFVGKDKAPGITSGINKKGDLLIQYIPKWYDIKIGDKVITSGMDDIFPLGIKVGVVKSITEHLDTNTITVDVYEKVLNKKDFYIIEN
jgi:rod shape-determining protein MreC